jgi:hypothetical protein
MQRLWGARAAAVASCGVITALVLLEFNGEVWADGVATVFKQKVLVEPLVFAIGKVERQLVLAAGADVVGVFLVWLRGIEERRAPPWCWIPRWRLDIVYCLWLRD